LKVVAKFFNGASLLANFASNKNDLKDCVILLDNDLQGMSGTEVARLLKDQNPEQRIVIAVKERNPAIEKYPSVEMIEKPFTISELVSTVGKISSPIRMKGNLILSERKEVENLLTEILTDSNKKLCSMRDFGPNLKGIQGHTSSYSAALSKGLRVFLITNITKENLYFWKQLMNNRMVQLRHLENISLNLSVWDEKHTMEVLQAGAEDRFGQVLYSNLVENVRKNQYAFDKLWSISTPAEQKIRELEAQNLENGSIKSIVGVQENLQARIRMLQNARSTFYGCYDSKIATTLFTPEIKKAYSDTVQRGVEVRHITEITSENLPTIRDLMKTGIDLRHLSGVVGGFAVNDFEFDAKASTESNVDSESIYSDNPEFVEQNRAVLKTLWNIATPALERIEELEAKNVI